MKLQSQAEQAAEAIRRQILARRWVDVLPGIVALGEEFRVNRNTIRKALKILEMEEWLESLGQGRNRRITESEKSAARRMRVGIMRYELNDPSLLEWLEAVRHQLEAAGHLVVIAPECLSLMKMNVRRIAKAVSKCEVDAWVVVAGSRQVLEWFIAQPTPVMSMCGHSQGLPMAAVTLDIETGFPQMLERLIHLGHRRIALLSRSTLPAVRKGAQPGQGIRLLMRTMEAHGLPCGPDNWPSFENDADRLYDCLNRLFAKNPPTAIFVDESFLAHVVFQYLMRHGFRVPEDVSLVCSEPSITEGWSQPLIAHLRWSFKPMATRTSKWVNKLARGMKDVADVRIRIEFIEGESMGPAPRAPRAGKGGK